VERTTGKVGPGRSWPRAAGLFGVVVATSVARPGVLIAIPLLMLLARRGLRGLGMAVAVVLSMFVAISGMRDGLWYVERGWAVLIGGGFLALTMAMPGWTVSARALGAVLGAGIASAAALAVSTGAWGALDNAIAGSVLAGVDATLEAMTQVGGGEGVSPGLVATFHQVAELQTSLFPALLGLESLAALGVAWWARTRLVGDGDAGLGPLREFRFNDHLVWILLGGLLLLAAQGGEAVGRLGSNAVLFMSALYALRGAAVFLFVSGGLSLFGYMMFALLILLAAPVVLGVAVLIGVGDTWLDLRARAVERPA